MSDDLTPQAAIMTAAFSHTPAAPSPPTIPANAPTATPTTPASSPQGPQAEITQAEATKIIEWAKRDLLSGKLVPEKANEIFDQLGATSEQRAPDTRTAAEKELDAAFPSSNPQDYSIPYFRPGEPAKMTPELKQFDTTARAWMSTAGLPTNLGNALVNTIAKVVQTTHTMTPEQLDSYVLLENEKLAAAYGDTLDAKLEAARQMVQALEAKIPGLNNLLKSKGIGDNALVVAQLIQASTVWHARRKGP